MLEQIWFAPSAKILLKTFVPLRKNHSNETNVIFGVNAQHVLKTILVWKKNIWLN